MNFSKVRLCDFLTPWYVYRKSKALKIPSSIALAWWYCFGFDGTNFCMIGQDLGMQGISQQKTMILLFFDSI